MQVYSRFNGNRAGANYSPLSSRGLIRCGDCGHIEEACNQFALPARTGLRKGCRRTFNAIHGNKWVSSGIAILSFIVIFHRKFRNVKRMQLTRVHAAALRSDHMLMSGTLYDNRVHLPRSWVARRTKFRMHEHQLDHCL